MASATYTLRPILQIVVADSGVLVVARRMLGIVATIAFPNQLLLRLLQLTREDDFRYHARALDVVYRGVVTLDWAIEYFVGDDLVQHCEGTNNKRICAWQPPPVGQPQRSLGLAGIGRSRRIFPPLRTIY